GATSKEEVKNYGVKPGDSVVPYFEFTQMKNEKMLVAKAFDNRIGCAIAIDVLKGVENENHHNTDYDLGTDQEEVALRGAGTSAHMIESDIGFAVDFGIAGDTPRISDKEADSKLGDGPQIILYDASMVSNTGLRDLVVNTAEKNDIPFQYSTMAGG